MNRVTTKYHKAGFLLAGFLLLYSFVFAQYPVSGEVLEVNNNYSDVRVELSSGNQNVDIPVSANGHFFTSLEWNKKYNFSFKKEGYVTKVIEFSTHLPEGVSSSSIEPYHMPVRLFRIFEWVDTVFFQNPVAKIRYDKSEVRSDGRFGDFADDRDYSLNVKFRIDQMRREGEEASASVKAKKPAKKPTKTKKQKRANNTNSENTADIPIKEEEQTPNTIDKDFARREMNGAPPLKPVYPEGETNEEFALKNRHIHRTIFVYNGQRKVFISVKHEWGGHFFFIDEAHIGYRCISKEVYEHSILNCRTKIKQYK
ncbi:hypothetical protein KEM09_05890 [Carboxylicivirga mesophila]|uniref:PEGA domain-containing protein n=1 Tax=Carboxylicivirga mesophila TaxID=1166478 RepID=A0ABS5K7G2_9BACT|nr:hypothetical protein [Carboxylicivirga mesophila]MBS2210920.1 hypothetical protein [Carboxylicivirga mesophila]